MPCYYEHFGRLKYFCNLAPPDTFCMRQKTQAEGWDKSIMYYAAYKDGGTKNRFLRNNFLFRNQCRSNTKSSRTGVRFGFHGLLMGEPNTHKQR